MKVSVLFLLMVGIVCSYANVGFDEEDIIEPALRMLKDKVETKLEEISHQPDREIVEIDDEEEEEFDRDEDSDDDDDDEASEEEQDIIPDEEEQDLLNEEEEQDEASDDSDDEFDVEERDEDEAELVDPCENVNCKPGKECIVTKDRQAKCRCISECSTPVDENEKICGSDNQTYASECNLLRTRCIYNRDGVKAGKHLKLDYYGHCKEFSTCGAVELSEFPTRMRSWLKNVYLQLYDQEENAGGLNEEQRTPGRKLVANRERLLAFERQSLEAMEREFSKFYPLYIYPVHWKFAALDSSPADKYLSKRELAPLTAALIPFEHCTKEFFKMADVNRDHLISFYEWCAAMGLKEEDMDLSLDL